jgi:hypothetical protein
MQSHIERSPYLGRLLMAQVIEEARELPYQLLCLGIPGEPMVFALG